VSGLTLRSRTALPAIIVALSDAAAADTNARCSLAYFRETVNCRRQRMAAKPELPAHRFQRAGGVHQCIGPVVG